MTRQAIKHCSSNHPEERVTLIRPDLNGDCGVGAMSWGFCYRGTPSKSFTATRWWHKAALHASAIQVCPYLHDSILTRPSAYTVLFPM